MHQIHINLRFLVLLFSGLLVLNACTPDPIDIDLPEAEQKLVISSQVIPNSLMLVTVSKSFSALRSVDEDSIDSQALLNELLVQNAQVSISYNGITDSLFAMPGVPGVYVSISTPQVVNTRYTLNVHDPETGLSVTSSARMLEFVAFDSLSARYVQTDAGRQVELSVHFPDRRNQENWYMVNVYKMGQEADTVTNIFAPDNETTHTILLNDKNLTSSQFSGTALLNYHDADTLAVSLSHISKDYYDYLAVRQKSNGLFSSITGEPINYPTNVIGGYGFFTTHFPDASVVIVQEP